MSILKLISSDNFIVVNKFIIKAIGLEEAIILGELASEYDYWLKNNKSFDGWFYSTIENMEEKTTLTPHKQRKAIEKLKELEIIEVKIKGIPAKRYIKINENLVVKNFNIKLLKNLTTRSEKISQLDVKNFNGNNNINNNNINNIIVVVEENFGRTLSPIEYEQILEWEDNELTEYAVKQSILKGVRNIKYINSILNEYKAKGIKTIYEAQEEEKKYKNKHKKREYKSAIDRFNEVLDNISEDDLK